MPCSSPQGCPDPDRTSLYQEITCRLIAELEAGRLSWVQPWGSSAVQAPLAMPRNATIGRRHFGINVLILWGTVVQHGFSGQSWLTFRQALASADQHLAGVDVAPTPQDPAELVADKGYHSRARLKELEDGRWKSQVAEPRRDGFLRWNGDDAARRAVYNHRARLLSEAARQASRLRAELVERGFALILDRGGMRRVWLRGRETVHKRDLIHVARGNLGLIMRLLTGAGTPRGSLAPVAVWLGAIVAADDGYILLLVVIAEDQIAALAVSLQPDPFI